MELTESIRIAAPVTRVFDAWAQLERAGEYRSAVVERRRLTAGPVGNGSRFRAVDRWPGSETAYIVEITAFDRPERIAATMSDPVGGGWDAIFVTVAEVTELTFACTLQPSGLRGLLLPLLAPLLRREARQALVGFRDWVESGRAARRPERRDDTHRRREPAR